MLLCRHEQRHSSDELLRLHMRTASSAKAATPQVLTVHTFRPLLLLLHTLLSL